MSIKKQRNIRIATRKSRLALWQAHWIKDIMGKHGVLGELVRIETQGDREKVAFSEMQGQGFFTKSVQESVLRGEADIAVHSLKDLPSEPCVGLSLAAIPCREDPRDLLLIRKECVDHDAPLLPLRRGCIVGTSAVRRKEQLLAKRSDIEVRELRGNVPTRVEKLFSGQYDAIMLATAGVKRLKLDLSSYEVHHLEPAEFVPAPGQGALALECRSDDEVAFTLCKLLHDPETARAVEIEREFMSRFHGGCQLSLGASAQILSSNSIKLIAWYQGKILMLEREDASTLIHDAYSFFCPSGLDISE